VELGIITDEVHPDFATACTNAAAWSLPLVEVRQVDGKNVVHLTDAEVDRAAGIIGRHGLGVSAVASPVFKSPLDERPVAGTGDFSVAEAVTVEAQLALLDRACLIAKRLGTDLVRVFTFLREPTTDLTLERLLGHMRSAAELAAGHGVVLAVENEPACIVGTGAELGRFFGRLDATFDERLRPHVAALWAPGNALALGEDPPYPDGYSHVPIERLAHVHLKDLGAGVASFGTFVPIGQGRIDYPGQLAALLRDGYGGSVVLEPHYAPPGVDSITAAHTCVVAAREALTAAGIAT